MHTRTFSRLSFLFLLLAAPSFAQSAPADPAPKPAWSVPCRITAVPGTVKAGAVGVELVTTADLAVAGVRMLPSGTRLRNTLSVTEAATPVEWTTVPPKPESQTMRLTAEIHPVVKAGKSPGSLAVGQTAELRVSSLTGSVAAAAPQPAPSPSAEPSPAIPATKAK